MKINDVIREHRAGMQYLGELSALYRTADQQQMNGWMGETLGYYVDEAGNAFNELGAYIGNTWHNASFSPIPHVVLDASAYAADTITETVEPIRKVTVEPIVNSVADTVESISTSANSIVATSKNVILWGAVIIGVLVIAPHVLDYMGARQRRKA